MRRRCSTARGVRDAPDAKGVSVLIATPQKRRRIEALLRLARVDATVEPAPSAEAVRERAIRRRLVEQLRPSGETAAEEDLAVARALLADSDPEQLVAAMVRSRRAALPSPEDLAAVQAPPPRPAPRSGFDGSAWFRVDIGRNRNAEARWLLPLICRMGGCEQGRHRGPSACSTGRRGFEIDAALRWIASARSVANSNGGGAARISPVDEPDVPAARDRKRPPNRPKLETRQPATSKRQMDKLKGRPRS